MLYWLPAAGASSGRLYWESFHQRAGTAAGVPMAAALFPKEIYRPSRRWAEHRFTDIRRWTEFERGGHFAAMEQPEALVGDIRAFFRLVR
jgi:pimeloyl-ACP methyl ester carboxylesterase